MDIDTTNPRDVVEKPFPYSAPIEEQIKHLLNFSVLAPSTHNSQPWRFQITGDQCTFFRDITILLPESDPTGRDAYISLGFCVGFFDLAARAHGFKTATQFHDTDDGVAVTVTVTVATKQVVDASMRNAIIARVNTRGIFLKRAVPEEVYQTLATDVDNRTFRDVTAHIIRDTKDLNRLGRLTAAGVCDARKRQAFRYEFIKWFHHNLSKKKDGIFGYSVLMNTPVSLVMSVLMKYLTLNPILKTVNYQSVASANAAVIYTAKRDTPRAWTEIGILASSMMLNVYRAGAKTSTYVASVEIGEHYKQVQEILGTLDRPQFVYVLGYSDKVIPPTPRYPVSEKMI